VIKSKQEMKKNKYKNNERGELFCGLQKSTKKLYSMKLYTKYI